MTDHLEGGPVLNHVAISVDAGVLDDDGRASRCWSSMSRGSRNPT